MPTLHPAQRAHLEKTVIAARDEAEKAALSALKRLAVDQDEPFAALSDDDKALRRRLRAEMRRLGSLSALVAECAYEQWHRMLFARFLAENGLLMHPEGVAVTLQDCADLAAEEGDADAWACAARYAARMLPALFRTDDPTLAVRLDALGRQTLERLLSALPAPVFTADDSIGWVYQFWQTRRKQEVNANGEKVGGADISPVTQLFTEHYMVEFLLHNSLGAWWAARHPEPTPAAFGPTPAASGPTPAASGDPSLLGKGEGFSLTPPSLTGKGAGGLGSSGAGGLGSGGYTPAVQERLLADAGGAGKDLGEWLRDGFFAQHCKTFGQRPFVWHVWDGRKDGFAALVNSHALDRAKLDKLIYTYLGGWIKTQADAVRQGTPGSDGRLVAAQTLQKKLIAIADGEAAEDRKSGYDIYVRWKPLAKQPLGWDPDINDGVRMNIRPFLAADVLRARPNIHWNKDRGKNPDGSDRLNDRHLTRAEKEAARRAAGS